MEEIKGIYAATLSVLDINLALDIKNTIKQAENVISILTGGRPHGLTNPEVIKTITINKLNGDKRWEDFKEFKLP